MSDGRLSISRGFGEGDRVVPFARPRIAPARAAPAPEAQPCTVADPGPRSLDYHLAHDRLTALERLARLREAGVLDEDEFAAEKATLLSLPREELVLRPELARPAPAPRGPSLAGRIFGWKLVSTGIVAGLCLSLFTNPQDLLTLVERTLRALG